MQGGYVTKWIGWCPLQQNWVTLNTEGCYQKESNQAGGDGILRLGICFAVEAKLWALIHGLRLALNKSIQYLVGEIDSLLAYTWITKNETEYISCSNLVSECKHLIKRSWAIDLQHVYRERNQEVDFLAAMSLR